MQYLAFLEVVLHFLRGNCRLTTEFCGHLFRPNVKGISMSRSSVAGSHLSVTDAPVKRGIGADR